MIGINSLSINNDFNALMELQSVFDGYECAKSFYIKNYRYLDLIKIPCTCFSSLVMGNYDLHSAEGRKKFLTEFIESCNMSNDIGSSKMMFGLLRYRKNISDDIIHFFEELVEVAKEHKQMLLFEALSLKTGNKFLTNHNELIDFSKKMNIPCVHVDFRTLQLEHECMDKLKYAIGNVHYPIGIPVMLDNVSLENYDNFTLDQIIHQYHYRQ